MDGCAEMLVKLEVETGVVIKIQGDDPFVHAEDLAILIDSLN